MAATQDLIESNTVGVSPSIAFVIRFFWAITWRSAVLTIPIMIIVGIFTASFFAEIGHADIANRMANLFTFIVSLVVWILVAKSVIGKRLGKHKLIVIPATDQ